MPSDPRPSGLHTADFDFDLPPEFVAQQPIEPRDRARLLHVSRQGLSDRHVYDLPELLRAGDLLVVNDTKVIPARLFGIRGERLRGAQSEPAHGGGTVAIEILLLRKEAPQTWLALAKPGKKLRPGDQIMFAENVAAELLEKRVSGEILIRFHATDGEIRDFLERRGAAPLPPYIRREKTGSPEDRARYQTVYAAREGAVAAPTAGLHFTPALMARLAAGGIECAKLTLHVGLGTFQPVKAELLKDHVMHAEWGEIDAATAAAINKARGEGRRVVAVGTTSLRLLETAATEGGTVRPFAGETDIFIAPGYRFRAADALLTNFHLPKSTLFMLVCAFAGTRRMRDAYEYAKVRRYRFYSYGDATLLEKA